MSVGEVAKKHPLMRGGGGKDGITQLFPHPGIILSQTNLIIVTKARQHWNMEQKMVLPFSLDSFFLEELFLGEKAALAMLSSNVPVSLVLSRFLVVGKVIRTPDTRAGLSDLCRPSSLNFQCLSMCT